jgi:hypothetical protein
MSCIPLTRLERGSNRQTGPPIGSSRIREVSNLDFVGARYLEAAAPYIARARPAMARWPPPALGAAAAGQMRQSLTPLATVHTLPGKIAILHRYRLPHREGSPGCCADRQNIEGRKMLINIEEEPASAGARAESGL